MLRGADTESCESECFVIIVDEEYEEEDEKHIIFLLTLVDKETTDLGNPKLSIPFVLANDFFISSEILVLTHVIRNNSNRKPYNG